MVTCNTVAVIVVVVFAVDVVVLSQRIQRCTNLNNWGKIHKTPRGFFKIFET